MFYFLKSKKNKCGFAKRNTKNNSKKDIKNMAQTGHNYCCSKPSPIFAPCRVSSSIKFTALNSCAARPNLKEVVRIVAFSKDFFVAILLPFMFHLS